MIKTWVAYLSVSEIRGKADVLKFGIANYNEECRSIVQRYSQEWKKTVTRIGRWIDFENDYKTMDPHFMVIAYSIQSYRISHDDSFQESIWWVFKTLNEKNLVNEFLLWTWILSFIIGWCRSTKDSKSCHTQPLAIRRCRISRLALIIGMSLILPLW